MSKRIGDVQSGAGVHCPRGPAHCPASPSGWNWTPISGGVWRLSAEALAVPATSRAAAPRAHASAFGLVPGISLVRDIGDLVSRSGSG
ncbi:hypothetical protein RB200_41975 [Streptomyces sp. PmtG]